MKLAFKVRTTLTIWQLQRLKTEFSLTDIFRNYVLKYRQVLVDKACEEMTNEMK